jgi:hypothetical protein
MIGVGRMTLGRMPTLRSFRVPAQLTRTPAIQ